MAISNILPRKIMRNRTRQQSMADRHDYDQKAEKTNNGELVSSYMCSPETAAEEFEISKQLYHQITGRSQSPDHDVIIRCQQRIFVDEVDRPPIKRYKNLYSQRKMLGGRGIFSPDKAHFRRNTLCIARKRNAVWRKKIRPHGV